MNIGERRRTEVEDGEQSHLFEQFVPGDILRRFKTNTGNKTDC